VTAPLVLVTASGLARETLAALRADGHRLLLGFVDDDPAVTGRTVDGLPVLGPLERLADHPEAAVVVCAGRGTVRLRIVDRLRDLGVDADRYVSVLHPTASVADGCVVGAGSILLAGVVLTAGVRLGAHVVAMPHVVLTHDDVVEDAATLCAGVLLGGGVRVGRAAYLGMGASVRENVRVGEEAVVGMGAVVLSDVPARSTVVGVPARAVDRAVDRAVAAVAPVVPLHRSQESS